MKREGYMVMVKKFDAEDFEPYEAGGGQPVFNHVDAMRIASDVRKHFVGEVKVVSVKRIGFTDTGGHDPGDEHR